MGKSVFTWQFEALPSRLDFFRPRAMNESNRGKPYGIVMIYVYIYIYHMDKYGYVMIIQWYQWWFNGLTTFLRENLNRKPARFSHEDHRIFLLFFPLNQSIDLLIKSYNYISWFIKKIIWFIKFSPKPIICGKGLLHAAFSGFWRLRSPLKMACSGVEEVWSECQRYPAW